MAEKLSTDPWTLLWCTPYVQLLQFVQTFLRAADVWTVSPEPPEAPAAESEIDELLGET